MTHPRTTHARPSAEIHPRDSFTHTTPGETAGQPTHGTTHATHAAGPPTHTPPSERGGVGGPPTPGTGSRERNRERRQELAAFRRLWSAEEQYPFWRSPGGGRSVHTRACRSAQSYIDTKWFPVMLTRDEVLTPRRPSWRPCKWCNPDINPPLRPLLPPRPKTQRDRVAAWLQNRYGAHIDNTTEDWQQAADELMRHMKNRDDSGATPTGKTRAPERH